MDSVPSPHTPAEAGAHEDCSDDPTLAARALVDRRAFAVLYSRYVNSVYAFCCRRLHSSVEAEDATSQVFCRALTELPRFRGGSFSSWLFAIARSVSIDRLRRRRRDMPITLDARVIDGGASPEEQTLISEGEQWVHTQLGLLPENQRQVVELRLAGFTGAEVAGILGKTHGAVKMLQFRAMETLRASMRMPHKDDQERREEAQHARY